jgi:hypothetical protein
MCGIRNLDLIDEQNPEVACRQEQGHAEEGQHQA